jgi:hypothetical protein
VYKRTNKFQLKDFWNEFIQSPEYDRIYKLVLRDNETISECANKYMIEVKTTNPAVLAELSLSGSTSKFEATFA